MRRNDTSLLQVPIDLKSGSPQADLRLAFWASIGFKPGSFMTAAMNGKRFAWPCRAPDRVMQPA